jgi:hypothetical protein
VANKNLALSAPIDGMGESMMVGVKSVGFFAEKFKLLGGFHETSNCLFAFNGSRRIAPFGPCL